MTPRTAAHQASLSSTISRSLLKYMFIVLMMPSSTGSLANARLWLHIFMGPLWACLGSESTGVGAGGLLSHLHFGKVKGKEAQRRTTLCSRSYADGTEGSRRVLPCSITLPTMKTSSLKICQSLEQSYSHSKINNNKIKNSITYHLLSKDYFFPAQCFTLLFFKIFIGVYWFKKMLC